jgi:hypothetical protein
MNRTRRRVCDQDNLNKITEIRSECKTNPEKMFTFNFFPNRT